VTHLKINYILKYTESQRAEEILKILIFLINCQSLSDDRLKSGSLSSVRVLQLAKRIFRTAPTSLRKMRFICIHELGRLRSGMRRDGPLSVEKPSFLSMGGFREKIHFSKKSSLLLVFTTCVNSFKTWLAAPNNGFYRAKKVVKINFKIIKIPLPVKRTLQDQKRS